MLVGMSYEPVMSDQADVIYDPRIHTHTSCLREVENCDAVILIIGSRFGGEIIPKALEIIDLDTIKDLSKSDKQYDEKSKISITQAEVLHAIQTGLPVFAFVDTGVMRDHLTYEKNKNKSIIKEIEFSSIDKSETASYIFEFINFLRLRNENNSIFEFSRFEDIEETIKKQWSGLFQRLIYDQRNRIFEGKRIDNLSSQIADLKAAVIGSISNAELKDTAKGAIRFRHMLEFLYGIALPHLKKPEAIVLLLSHDKTWNGILTKLGIISIQPDNENSRFSSGIIVLREDQTYYRARLSIRIIPRLETEWEDFRKLGRDAKEAILNAVLDSTYDRPINLIRYYKEPFIEDSLLKIDEQEIDADNLKRLSGSRILLTADKFIEEEIKSYLISQPSFEKMHFLVDAKDENLTISKLPESLSGPITSFTYSYKVPENGKLSAELSRIKILINKDLMKLSEPNTKDKVMKRKSLK